jgi:hypothetical protein
VTQFGMSEAAAGTIRLRALQHTPEKGRRPLAAEGAPWAI